MHSHKPPRQSIQAQHGGSPPYTDIAIEPAEAEHGVVGLHGPQPQTDDGALQEHEQQPDAEADGERAQENAHHLVELPAAVGLRCHAAGAHAQEAEHPVEHVEYRRAYGYGTDIPGVTYVAYNGHIDKSQ